MKILFITYEDPFNAIAGDSMYSRDIISNLKDISSQVDILTYTNNISLNLSDITIKSFCHNIFYVPFKQKSKILLLVSKYPTSIKNRKNRSIINKFKELTNNNQYDCILINHFKLAFLIEHASIKNTNQKIVLITHNFETGLAKSLYQYTKSPAMKLIYLFEYFKVNIYEKRFLAKYDIITAISDCDVKSIKELAPLAHVHLLTPIVTECKEIKVHPKQNNIILCGSFMWEPKKENLLQLVYASNFNKLINNQIKLLIVGNAPNNLIDKVNKINGVLMTGYVSETASYYKDAKVALVPELLGGGFKLKIAEAVSHKIPIVALNIAITDYEMVEGIHYLGANNVNELIDKAILLINNPVLSLKLVNNCTELFNRKYSSIKIKERLTLILS